MSRAYGLTSNIFKRKIDTLEDLNFEKRFRIVNCALGIIQQEQAHLASVSCKGETKK